MRIQRLCLALARLCMSVLCAGAFYMGWLAVFLALVNAESRIGLVFGWLLAPLITALGFALGTKLCDWLTKTGGTRFLWTFAWATLGCAVGAGAVFPFGPMLIVFGMFAAGTATMAALDVVAGIEQHRAQRADVSCGHEQ